MNDEIGSARRANADPEPESAALRDARTAHLRARPASQGDAAVIARIYNEGIDDGIATFETRHRTPEDIAKWIGGRFPTVVVECARDGVIAFASTSEYRARECYAGIAEFSVYVSRAHRGRGAGRVAMAALISAAERAGFWKLVSRVFVENLPSRALLRDLGFREVGIYERHARLYGAWRDVVIVERPLTGPRDSE
jgi:L-amino acid N-acyltransferase YncA